MVLQEVDDPFFASELKKYFEIKPWSQIGKKANVLTRTENILDAQRSFGDLNGVSEEIWFLAS